MERSSVGEFICNGAARIARQVKRPLAAGLYLLKKDSSTKRQEYGCEGTMTEQKSKGKLGLANLKYGGRRTPRPLRLPHKMKKEGLLCRRFCTNNFVALDNRGDPHAGRTVVGSLVDTHYLAHGADENFRAACHFRRKCERYVEFGSRTKILINRKIDAAR